jgi:cysteine synthase A
MIWLTLGLFVGSSSCVNLCAAVHIARQLGPGHRIVTILCDSGSRHMSKFYNDEWLKGQGITVRDRYDDLSFLDEAKDAQNSLRQTSSEG